RIVEGRHPRRWPSPFAQCGFLPAAAFARILADLWMIVVEHSSLQWRAIVRGKSPRIWLRAEEEVSEVRSHKL
ncbi:MAG: hypothetical protein ABIQ57_05005, partial [Candidatus Kapaibacterium sp.]